MGNVLSFEKYKEEFYAEFDEYYSTYPIDVEKEIGKLDKEKRDENPCTEKERFMNWQESVRYMFSEIFLFTLNCAQEGQEMG